MNVFISLQIIIDIYSPYLLSISFIYYLYISTHVDSLMAYILYLFSSIIISIQIIPHVIIYLIQISTIS
jgi:hypothetical protein